MKNRNRSCGTGHVPSVVYMSDFMHTVPEDLPEAAEPHVMYEEISV